SSSNLCFCSLGGICPLWHHPPMQSRQFRVSSMVTNRICGAALVAGYSTCSWPILFRCRPLLLQSEEASRERTSEGSRTPLPESFGIGDHLSGCAAEYSVGVPAGRDAGRSL